MVDRDFVNMKSRMLSLFLLLFLCDISKSWIHNLKLTDDSRSRITLSRSFGFLTGGTVAVNVTLFSCNGTDKSKLGKGTLGFTLEKSRSQGLAGYMENINRCVFKKEEKEDTNRKLVYFIFDLENNSVIVERNHEELANLTIVDMPREEYLFRKGLAHGVNPDFKGAADKQGAGKTTPAQVVEGGATSQKTTADAGAPDNTDDEDYDNDENTEDDDDFNDESESTSTVAPAGKEKTKEEKTETKTEKTDDPSTRRRKRREAEKEKDGKEETVAEGGSSNEQKAASPAQPITLPMTHRKEHNVDVYQTYFLVHIKNEAEEGLYSLFFHNCHTDKCHVDLTVQIIQENNGDYLSADEMPIPALYFLFSVVFFILTVAWFSVLRRAEEGVYKIHYLMLVVVFFKCLSSLFHGVNMHMLRQTGIHVDAWAILWYIVYLMKGAVMFVTVLLIGAGWAFIKHVFTDREKKLFLIVIPFQVLMNVAWVIMEESEEGYSSYNTWTTIFICVDLLCCFIILFPVIWTIRQLKEVLKKAGSEKIGRSIRHLQEASRTDGKAAINLNKLKLFRHFYILVVAYIYSTRIIGYLLQITLPFRYGWMKDLCEEIFLLVFFSVTGYKFRPTSDNPYLQVPLDSEDEEEIEMDEVVTKSGATESVVRVNQARGDNQSQSTTTAKQRESSHEYD